MGRKNAAAIRSLFSLFSLLFTPIFLPLPCYNFTYDRRQLGHRVLSMNQVIDFDLSEAFAMIMTDRPQRLLNRFVAESQCPIDALILLTKKLAPCATCNEVGDHLRPLYALAEKLSRELVQDGGDKSIVLHALMLIAARGFACGNEWAILQGINK